MGQLESISVFVKAVERGSFAAAAQELRLTGTMVGTHVRSLEDRLGTKLLNRTTRRQSLTEAGRLYYERCKKILAEVTDAQLDVADLQAIPKGRLKIVSQVSFGVHALTPACAEFIAKYPTVSVDLVVSDRLADLVNEDFDIAFRIGDLPDSALIARPLDPYASIICASPDYFAKRGTPLHPTDLSHHTCLGLAHPIASREWRLRGPDGMIHVPVSLAMSINNGEALRTAALSGLGIIMQPEVLLNGDVAAGRLIPILADYLPTPKPMHLMTFRHRRPTAKIRMFVEFALERFGRRAARTRLPSVSDGSSSD
ncbi:LysR family transcriptional regulator [Methylovirgula sp. 4M-Z18]|uniref:LysR family transcriptional regulator n=1 Tax=Methylovirgula sp. 4M-Z18 TaxID=2293567 RepID=UPI000E2EDEFC|nr:LysR family transcriptional regulator [Methylovirgula sp. 4M-Z18]RFB79120.1 LysR family transcriptional regulator [Methylovirgula sp. 4M-Z18]